MRLTEFIRLLSDAASEPNSIAHMNGIRAAADREKIPTLAGDVPRLSLHGSTVLTPERLQLSCEVAFDPKTGEVGHGRGLFPHTVPLTVMVEWRAGPIPEAVARVQSNTTRSLRGLSNDA